MGHAVRRCTLTPYHSLQTRCSTALLPALSKPSNQATKFIMAKLYDLSTQHGQAQCFAEGGQLAVISKIVEDAGDAVWIQSWEWSCRTRQEISASHVSNCVEHLEQIDDNLSDLIKAVADSTLVRRLEAIQEQLTNLVTSLRTMPDVDPDKPPPRNF